MDEIAATLTPRTIFLCAAFWAAVVAWRGTQGGGRFVVGLAAGAVMARVGWSLLHARSVVMHPEWLLDPLSGHSLLFVPLGPLLLAYCRRAVGRDDAFLAASWRTLPCALATARLGCVAAGCCSGVPIEWAGLRELELRHPVAAYEIALWLVLAVSLARGSAHRVLCGFPLGFGMVRLLVEPWRAGVVGLEPTLPAWSLGVGWIVFGVVLCVRPLAVMARSYSPSSACCRSRAARSARRSAYRAAVAAPRRRRCARARSTRR
ncbi:MAG: prolipoprotein diacylglyceryl transferase [Deltaproteobacteria bacterium]|nr:prolipoprotein diacylglyceryl transferase [Deltaproteobacteria bacterium]MBW2698179.1 prolipoprotein diacylglyceryl transferase [Deltaproteobacteria bacterium]